MEKAIRRRVGRGEGREQWRRRASAPHLRHRESARSKSALQLELDSPPGRSLAPSCRAACIVARRAYEGKEMIDEGEVPPTRGEDPRGLVAVAQIRRASSECRDRSLSPVRAALAVCAGRRALGVIAGVERDRQRLHPARSWSSATAPALGSAGDLRTCLEREHAANCEQPEEPDPHPRGRADRPGRSARPLIASS